MYSEIYQATHSATMVTASPDDLRDRCPGDGYALGAVHVGGSQLK